MLPTSCPTRSKLVSKMRTIASVQIWGPNMRPKNGSHQVVQNDPNWFIKRELPFESMGPVAQADPNLPRPPHYWPLGRSIRVVRIKPPELHCCFLDGFRSASLANSSQPILADFVRLHLQLAQTCLKRRSHKMVSNIGLNQWFHKMV